jgi:uncharacterized membrane protein
MKILRLAFIIVGCILILVNIIQILTGPPFRFPSDASMGEMMGLYIQKLYLLVIGIFALVFSTLIGEKIRKDQMRHHPH